MPDEKNYVLGFIFDGTLDNVLLIQRSKDPYKGLLNGVGGKIEQGESAISAIYREIWEETVYSIAVSDIHPVCKVSYPSGTNLDVFACTIPSYLKDTEPRVTEEGTLSWFSVAGHDLTNIHNEMLAGEGNVAYFISYAQTLLSQ